MIRIKRIQHWTESRITVTFSYRDYFYPLYLKMKTAPVIIVQLIHIEGPLKGQIVELSDHEIKIGRHPSCQLQYPRDMAIISRQHATIFREGNRFKIIDQSSNGTIVNGRRITETFLKDGDVITVSEGGPKVSFLTQMTNKTAPVPETPETPQPQLTPPKPLPQEPPPSPKAAPPQVPPPQVDPPQLDPPKVNQPNIEAAKVETAPASQQPLTPQKSKTSLIIQYGPTLQSFDELPLQIGQHPSCGFLLNHPNILDLHAEIFYADEQYYIRDLTGQQIIRSNGVAADQGVALRRNDVISFSQTGPFFKFLGDGRLSEEVIEVEESQGNEQEAMSPDANNEKSRKKPLSFFKKVFSRD